MAESHRCYAMNTSKGAKIMFGKTSLIIKTGASLLAVLQPSFAASLSSPVFVAENNELIQVLKDECQKMCGIFERMKEQDGKNVIQARITSCMEECLCIVGRLESVGYYAREALIQEHRHKEELYDLIMEFLNKVRVLEQQNKDDSTSLSEVKTTVVMLKRRLTFMQGERDAFEQDVFTAREEAEFERGQRLIAEQERDAAERRADTANHRADAAERRITELEALLARK
jgi:hypothetical protein